MSETAKLFKIDSEMAEGKQINREQVRDMLRSYLEATGKSQSLIAKAIGFSPAALTGFLKGTYAGDMDEIAVRIQEYLDRETQRLSGPQEPKFVETNFAKQMQMVIEYTRMNNDIGMIHGDAGVGKTTVLQLYVERHSEVIFITAGVDLSTPKAVAEELLDQLGRKEYYGGLNKMGKIIIQALKVKGSSGRLIIIDEANHLNARAKEFLRKINDQAGVGIIYCGTHDLYQQMRGAKGIIYAQLLSRIGIRRSIDRKEISKDDISLLFEQSSKLDDDCLQVLYEQAKGEGGIRYAKKLYMLASSLSYGANKTLSIQFLHDASEMLMGR